MEKQHSSLSNGNKVKLLCSYGGKIQLRPTDHQLSYVGGDTKILAVDRTVRFSDIIAKMSSLFNRNDGGEVSIKYQLPGEDLDALVSLIDDEDVEHMMVEYDRMQRISTKPARLRIFVFDVSGPVKSGCKEAISGNPDYLFGFDKEYHPSIEPPLDLLQIPGMLPPDNCKTGVPDVGVNRLAAIAPGNMAAAQVVYRVPAVVRGGAYRNGAYRYGVGTGNLEQPVYNFAPIMPPVSENDGLSWE